MILGKAISPFALRKKINGGGGGGTDPDAQLFITATGISGTNATATNKLVIDLKSANIWTKMKAVYPMVGGTATTCKYNLKDARDLDAAYRLVFSGGGTFSSNGYLPNGINSYAIPFVNIKNVCSDTSHSFGIYSRTNDTSNTRVYGCWFENAAASQYLQNNVGANIISGGIETLASYTPVNTLGLINLSRTSNNSLKYYKNGVVIATNTTTQVYTLPNVGFMFGGRYRSNDLSVDFFDNHQTAFAYISNGLTDAEALALYNAVQLFNTTLSRQI